MSTFKNDTGEVSVDFKIQFDLTSSPTLDVRDNSTFSHVQKDIKIFIRITRPDGIVREPDFETPDISNISSVYEFTLPLSSSDGKVAEGNYIVEYYFTVGDDELVKRQKQFNFNFEYISSVVKNKIDEFTPLVQVVDETPSYDVTNYNLNEITRVFTSSYPNQTLEIPSYTSLGNGSKERTYSLSDIEGNYFDTTYQTYLDVNCVYTNTQFSWVSVKIRFSSSIVTDVYSTPTRIEVLSYIDTLRNLMETYDGYNRSLFDKYNKDYEFVVTSFQHLTDRLAANLTNQDTTEILRNILDVIRNNVPREHQGDKLIPVDVITFAPSADWNKITNIPTYNPFATYEKKFPTPLHEWEVIHQLNKKPTVTLVDDYENIVYGAVEYLNLNIIKITFNTLTSGKVYLN